MNFFNYKKGKRKRIVYLLSILISFALGGGCFFLLYMYYRSLPRPVETGLPKVVNFQSTNLPILLIGTQGDFELMSKDRSVVVDITLIDNGEGELNYPDLIEHADQLVDYRGEASLRFRGYGSNMENKKSYAISLEDDEEGNKDKASLLGMKRSNKWALLAVHRDGSLMRDVLTYELARPYFDYVPQMKYVELVIDGVYQGVYLLGETVNDDRLRLKKSQGDNLEGGFLMEHDDGQTFVSAYSPLKIDGDPYDSQKIWFEIKYPKQENLSSGQHSFIESSIKQMEASFAEGACDYNSPIIDVESFASYQLVQEAANNLDAYSRSVKFYKPKGKNTKIKMLIWDFDIAYGAVDMIGSTYTNIWRYRFPRYTFPQLMWWYNLSSNDDYQNLLKRRWKQFRTERYSTDFINQKIDSLYCLLTEGGAIDRNSRAWDRYHYSNNTRSLPRQSYEQEVEYLKLWLLSRISFMDEELLGISANQELCDSVYRELGKQMIQAENHLIDKKIN